MFRARDVAAGMCCRAGRGCDAAIVFHVKRRCVRGCLIVEDLDSTRDGVRRGTRAYRRPEGLSVKPRGASTCVLSGLLAVARENM